MQDREEQPIAVAQTIDRLCAAINELVSRPAEISLDRQTPDSVMAFLEEQLSPYRGEDHAMLGKAILKATGALERAKASGKIMTGKLGAAQNYFLAAFENEFGKLRVKAITTQAEIETALATKKIKIETERKAADMKLGALGSRISKNDAAYQPRTGAAGADGAGPAKTDPDRFEPGKPAGVIFKCFVSGEDANDILDAVPGSTRAMIRKAIRDASESDASKFGGDKFTPAQIAPLLRWITTEVEWAVAYATHGDPEKLVGEKIASAVRYTGTPNLLKARQGAVPQSLIDALRQEYPVAWVNEHKGQEISSESGAICWPVDTCIAESFTKITEAMRGAEYGPVGQQKIADAVRAAVQQKASNVESAIRRMDELEARQRENIVRDRAEIVELPQDTGRENWFCLDWGQMNRPRWLISKWGPLPGRHGCLIPQDMLDEAVALHAEKQAKHEKLRDEIHAEFATPF